MIQLEGASLRYEDGAVALRDASVSLTPGSLHFLTGPSGSGKSSLLRMLYLARRPTSGRLTLFGRDANGLSRREIADMRRTIGVIFQDQRLLDHLTVYENIALPLIATGEQEQNFRANLLEMLDWVRLREKLNAYPSSLSGGERQRLAIARAMVSVPEIILADEPTGSVDPEMAERIMALFMEMQSQDHVVLIATHDLRLAEKSGAPILEIRDGAILPARLPEPPAQLEQADQDREPAASQEIAEEFTEEPAHQSSERSEQAAPPSAPPRPADKAPILPWSWNSAGMVTAIIAAMAFLASMVLAIHAGADQLRASWTETLERRATLTLTLPTAKAKGPNAAEEARKARILMKRVLALAANTPGIEAAEALPEDAVETLLSRSLGEHAAVLPPMRLVDLRLAEPSGSPSGRAALSALRSALAQERLQAEVEAHGEWIEKLRPVARGVVGLAQTALVVIGLVCALTVALACSMAMAAHAQVVDLLRMVGAYDAYIARLFVRRFQILAICGGVFGVSLGAAALFLLQIGVPTGVEPGALAPLAPELSLDPGLWARFALTPLALVLITSLAARLLVEFRLRRMEG